MTGGDRTHGHEVTGSRVLWLWTCAIVVLVVPWATLQNHSHWANVGWIPFVSGPVRANDIVGNVLLYLPFAYFYARGRGRRGFMRTMAFAFVLSVTSEFTQVYGHGRFPSATDVTCNVIGACIGGLCARHVQLLAPGSDAYEPSRP
jgi:glycopeptide antibiotics resistance protein